MDNVSLVLLVEVKLPVRIYCFYILLAIISQHVYKLLGSLSYIIDNNELAEISIATIPLKSVHFFRNLPVFFSG